MKAISSLVNVDLTEQTKNLSGFFKFAFILAGIFLLIAGLVLASLQLYRGTENS